MALLILLVPRTRSTKVIGISATVRPARTARKVRSIWKQYPCDIISPRESLRSVAAR